MSTETASLVIKVDSSDPKEAAANLDTLTHSAESSEKATDKLTDTIKELAVSYISLEGAMKFLEKLFDTTVEFQNLEARVKTASGSVLDASAAFEQLRDIAADTPFQLSEVVAAFVKLQNTGLDPSSAALRAYANLAQGVGVSLTTVTDAIAQAANGQFRGLNALNIAASETSTGLRLTFAGVTTQVRENSNDIQKYIQNIGNTKFGTATAEQAKTLGGQLNTLKTTWDDLFVTVSQSGAGDLMSKALTTATSALKELTEALASGQVGGYIKAIGESFTGLGDDFYATTNLIAQLWETMLEALGTDSNAFLSFFKKALIELPENVRAVLQFVGTGLAEVSGFIGATWDLMAQEFSLAIDQIIKIAKATGPVLNDALNPFSKGDFAADFHNFTTTAKQGIQEFTVVSGANVDQFTEKLKAVAYAGNENVNSALDQRDATAKSVADQIAKSDQLLAAFKKAEAARKAALAQNDPLKPKTPSTNNGDIITPADISAFQALKKQLQLQEVTIYDSYTTQKDTIEKLTKDSLDERNDLEAKLDDQLAIQLDKASQDRYDKVAQLEQKIQEAMENGQDGELAGLQASLQQQEQAISDSYAFRQKQILSDTKTTEAQKTALLEQLQNQENAKVVQLQKAQNDLVFGQYEKMFGSIADAAAAGLGKQNAAYKVAFAASKAFAIADATVKLAQGIAASAAPGGVFGIAQAVAFAAEFATIVEDISSVNLAFDTGGMIPAGKTGMVGENGVEFVRGPAVVQSRRSTADNYKGGSGGGDVNVAINVNNTVSGAEVTATARDTDQGKVIDLVVKQAAAQLTGQVTKGGSPFTKALESTYKLSRGQQR